MNIFLDESGQFKVHNHEQYFVIGSFTVGDTRRTAKGLRSFFSRHFPKKMRDQNEIKWSATGIPDTLRLKTLRYISNLDVHIRYIYINKNQ